jgi:enediyne biosynthesis protein E3
MMALSFGKMLKPFFKLSADTFQDLAAERYGRQEDMDRTWLDFEPVARTLVDSFKMTLDDDRFDVLVPRLEAIDVELRGIAYEGAGMGLMLMDGLGPWKKRLKAFVDGPGAPYICLVYIGAGLVMPRMPGRPERFLKRLEPFYCWMAMDGYGFYEGFFSGKSSVEQHIIPKRISGYARRAFDHGLGRSIWFSTGANVERIQAAIASFPEERQADLWSGIGLACAYAAGVVDREAIQRLQQAAGSHGPQMAVGTAIAATFRQQAGSSAPHTELACDVLWNMTGEKVARLASVARENIPGDRLEPAYEIWRQRIATLFIEQAEGTYTQKKEAMQ